MAKPNDALPPLPEPATLVTDSDVGYRCYTAFQMRDYARAALAAQPVATERPATCVHCDNGAGVSAAGTHAGEPCPYYADGRRPGDPVPDFVSDLRWFFPAATPSPEASNPVQAEAPGTNVVRLPVVRQHLHRLVEDIKEAVYQHSGEIGVAEAIGALEVAKLEIFQEHQ